MKNTSKRFNKATEALYNAFFNGTLAKGNCAYCAVGNLVADSIGYKVELDTVYYKEYDSFPNTSWRHLFCTSSDVHDGTCIRSTRTDDPTLIEKALKEIQSTGYSEQELSKVEFAFETNTRIHLDRYYQHSEQEILEDQYNGLVAVFNVLLEIEGISNDGHIEKLKTHPKLQIQ